MRILKMMKTAGTSLNAATAGVVLIHGRGASAESMLHLVDELDVEGVAFAAPQAERFSWYPNSFLAPLEANEPGITNGIETVMQAVERFEDAGVPAEKVALVGFSQGACLVSEAAARNPRRYGGLVLLSGGLIGSGQKPDASPPDDKTFEYEGSLQGTPVFVGCSDVDPHIPVERVEVTADVFRRLNGDVTLRIYEGMGHTVNREEVDFLRELIRELSDVTGKMRE